MSLKHGLLRLFFPLVLASCGALPASGPYSQYMSSYAALEVDIEPFQHNGENHLNYAVIGINQNTLGLINQNEQKKEGLILWPSKTSPEVLKVNVGDTIQITIYEAQTGGLFIPEEAGVRPGNFVSLPPQTIEHAGYVTVPYVGLVKAAGRTTAEISQSIASSLSDRAIEPQVVVSFSNRGSSEVSVMGAVEEAVRFSLDFNGDKVLDAIASAGGPSAPGYETWVSLQRAEEEYTIAFDQLVMDSEKNIYLQPNDTVYLYREPETFMAYGATQIQGSIPFGKRELYLSEALGLASGLRDIQADPAEIYIYRHENKEILDFLSSDEAAIAPMDQVNASVPIIYKLDLRNPKGFFWAQKFPMQDEDIIYVANAKSVEFLKFLNILNNTATTATNSKATKNAY